MPNPSDPAKPTAGLVAFTCELRDADWLDSSARTVGARRATKSQKLRAAMSKPVDPESLDAATILEESAALAAHLQRVGVRWIPASQPEAVAKLKLQMEMSIEVDLPPSDPSTNQPVQPVTQPTPAATCRCCMRIGLGAGGTESSPLQEKNSSFQKNDKKLFYCITV